MRSLPSSMTSRRPTRPRASPARSRPRMTWTASSSSCSPTASSCKPIGWRGEEMASFPIFVDLGRAAPLVVGGGNLALSKVRLLLKRVDRVAVAAAALVEGFQPLIDDGRIERLTIQSMEELLRARPLVISATEDDAQDA